MSATALPGPARPAAPPASWRRIAFAMFAVGWGANQFSPMLLVYRQRLGLTPAALAGLFAVYAAALIPGLLAGGPASDRFGRRPVVLPFVVASPCATLLLMAGAHTLPVLAAGRALAGLCSGVVFAAATAWVRELSPDAEAGARRAAVALTAGFGLGPLVASGLAQWAGDPLVLPYLPHVLVGLAAAAATWPVRGGVRPAGGPAPAGNREPGGSAAVRPGRYRVGGPAEPRRGWPPPAVRSAPFWLAVAPAAPWVFGCAALAFVILPAAVPGPHGLSVVSAGVIGALALGTGVAAQPFARRLAARRRLAGNVAGLVCAAAGAALAVPAVAAGSTAVAGACAVLFGLGYGLCLVTGLRESERLAGPGTQGAVVACFYALTYLGFGFPYLADGLAALAGRTAAFAVLAGAALASAAWTAAYAARSQRSPGLARPERVAAPAVPARPDRPATSARQQVDDLAAGGGGIAPAPGGSSGMAGAVPGEAVGRPASSA